MTEGKSSGPGEIEWFESDEPEAPSEPSMAPAAEAAAPAEAPSDQQPNINIEVQGDINPPNKEETEAAPSAPEASPEDPPPSSDQEDNAEIPPTPEAPSSEAAPEEDAQDDESEPEELDPVEEEAEEEPEAQQHLRAIFGVRVEMMICVGSARPLIGDLLEMRRDALLPLNSRVQDPLEIRISNRVVGRGELKELEDGSGRLGVVVTEFSDLMDAL